MSTLDDVLTSLYGGFCALCETRRTRNPSRVCSPCLRKEGRLCRRCFGSGTRYGDSGPEGCAACGGTGKT